MDFNNTVTTYSSRNYPDKSVLDSVSSDIDITNEHINTIADAQTATSALLSHSSKTDAALDSMIMNNSNKLDDLEKFLTEATHKYYYHSSLYNDISTQVYNCNKLSQGNLSRVKQLEVLTQWLEELNSELNHRELQANQAVIAKKRLIYDINQQLEHHNIKITQYKDEISQIDSRYKKIKQRINMLEKSLKQVEQDIANSINNIENKKKIDTENSQFIQNLESRIEGLLNEQKSIKEKSSNDQETILHVKSKISTEDNIFSNLKNIQSILESFYQNIQASQKTIVTQNEAIENKKVDIESLQITSNNLTIVIENAQRHKEDIEASFENLKQKKHSLTKELEKLPSMTVLREHSKTLTDVEQEYNKLNNEFNVLKKQSEDNKQIDNQLLDEVICELELVQAEYYSIMNNGVLEETLNKYGEDLNIYQQQHEQLKVELEGATSYLEQLQTNHNQSIEALNIEIAEAEKQIDDDHNDRKLVSQLNTKRKECSSKKQYLEHLDKQLELYEQLAQISQKSYNDFQIIEDKSNNNNHNIFELIKSIQQVKSKIDLDLVKAQELQNLHQSVAKRKSDEEAEAKRRAEEIEAKRKAEEEAECKRKAEEEAEAKRKAEEAEAKRKAEEAEAKRIAEEEAENKRKAEEAEAKREAKRKAQEAKAKRKAEEAEAKRKAEEEAEAKRKAEEEAENKRKAEEAEAKRKAREAEAKRKAEEEAEIKRKEEKEIRRKKKEESEKQKARDAEFAQAQEEARLLQEKSDAALKRKQVREAARAQRELANAALKAEEDRLLAAKRATLAMISPGGTLGSPYKPLRSSMRSSVSKSKNINVSFNDSSIANFQSPPPQIQDEDDSALVTMGQQRSQSESQEVDSNSSSKVKHLYQNIKETKQILNDENTNTSNSQTELLTPDSITPKPKNQHVTQKTTKSHMPLTTPLSGAVFNTSRPPQTVGSRNPTGSMPRNVLGLGGLIPNRSGSIFKRVNTFGKR